MFYSALALFSREGIGRSRHSGVLSIFDREYIKTKVFSKEMSKLFHQSFNLRQECDYGELDFITKNEVLEIMNGAKKFLNTIKEYIKADIPT